MCLPQAVDTGQTGTAPTSSDWPQPSRPIWSSDCKRETRQQLLRPSKDPKGLLATGCPVGQQQVLSPSPFPLSGKRPPYPAPPCQNIVIAVTVCFLVVWLMDYLMSWLLSFFLTPRRNSPCTKLTPMRAHTAEKVGPRG